jgi:hypothetical protein
MSWILKIKLDFNFGDVVFYKTDKENTPFVVTGISVINKNITYRVESRGEVLYAFVEELTTSPVLIYN